MTKLSEKLTVELGQRNSSDLLDVILEMRPLANSRGAGSRSEKISALKETFDRNVAPIEEVIRKAGGEITGRAWINQTLRARIPARKLKELAEHETIAAVDIPHPIIPDSI